jgi:aerobic-type carbon monoxide dehydrogenase small subunit (CoxS/CutS family)
MTNLNVNGAVRGVETPAFETLLETLRERLALTGAKRGCNQGVCGACTVLLDGRAVRSCLTLTANCDEATITTAEGLAPAGRLSRLQQAFADAGAVQCGFCTAGMLMSAYALLQRNAKPGIDDIREGMAGNLCRCSGFRKIVDAVRLAAEG